MLHHPEPFLQGKGSCGTVDAGTDVGLKRSMGLFGSVKELTAAFYDGWVGNNSNFSVAEKEEKDVQEMKSAPRVKRGDKSEFSMDEVVEHNTKQDCWIVIKGSVYDVTEFAPSHPGGQAIYSMGGRDATDVFAAFHDGRTWGKLKQYKIGTVTDAESKATALMKDFREMRQQMVAEGLFKSSMLYYVFKLLSTFGLAVASYLVLQAYPASIVGFMASTFLIALFWQQSGWLSHDFCHNQVFKNRAVGHVFGMLTGNIFQGFSVAWWKNKHNTHHAVPNELHGDQPQDPDIDTLPFIAWDEGQLKNVSPGVRKLVRVQHWLFGPILLFARISWATQSIQYAMEIKDPMTCFIETTGIMIHYTWMLSIPFLSGYSILGCLGFLLVAEMIAGFLLAFVFIQSHNGMEVYGDAKDFASSQLVSTRNIHYGIVNDWFSGGLNLQIEHHLFPTMPRHNLGKAAGHVQNFCAKHSVVYENVGWCEGTTKVIARLREISKLA